MSIQNEPYPHRREATRLLNDPYVNAETASAAMAHALLAIEQRLGELVVQQEAAVTIAAFQTGVIHPGSEYVAARITVREVLGLHDPEHPNQEGENR